jgi:hypothetical protein
MIRSCPPKVHPTLAKSKPANTSKLREICGTTRPLPERITLQFNDSKGTERRQTLRYMQFYMTPTLGDEVNIRYLPDAPDDVLGPVAARDVGFESALPYGIGILAIYSFVQLIVLGASRFRTRRTR